MTFEDAVGRVEAEIARCQEEVDDASYALGNDLVGVEARDDVRRYMTEDAANAQALRLVLERARENMPKTEQLPRSAREMLAPSQTVQGGGGE